MSAAELGVASGAWFAAFALAQLPIGWALDVFGPRRTATLIMLSAVAGALLFAAATRGWHTTAAMALIGIGCAPIYMSALYVFARTIAPERFALFASWLLAIGTSGNLLAATPLAAAAAAYGWRTTFLAIAGVTALAAVLVCLVVRDPPPAEASEPSRGMINDLGTILTIRALWPLLPIIAVSYAIVAGERGLWIGPYLSEVHQLDAVARGNSALVMAAAMSVGAFVYGPLDQWLGTRKWIVFVGSCVTAAAFAVLGGFRGLSPGQATVTLAVIGAAGSTYAVLMAHGRQFLPEHLLGRGLTLLNFMFMAGIGFIQWLSGAYVDAARAAGIPAEVIYARLHIGFAVLLFAATTIYLASRDR
jgi:predicted MFS family arabinose efflux permease